MFYKSKNFFNTKINFIFKKSKYLTNFFFKYDMYIYTY